MKLLTRFAFVDIIFSRNCLMLLILLYWMFKIFTSLYGIQELTRQEASSVITVPAIIILAAFAGIFLDAFVLLLPFIVATMYEMIVSSVKMAMIINFAFRQNYSFDPAEKNIALLHSIFRGYHAQMKQDLPGSFAKEGCIFLFCFLTFFVTLDRICQMSKKERERQARQMDRLLNQHRRILIDFPDDDIDDEGSARIALSPPTYSMAIRHEGVRRFAPELCITEDTAPPCYSAIERDRSSLARTPLATALPPPLSTPHSAGMVAPPTYSTPAIARFEPHPPMSERRNGSEE